MKNNNLSAEAKQVQKIMRQAVREEARGYLRDGLKMAVMENGKVKLVSPRLALGKPRSAKRKKAKLKANDLCKKKRPAGRFLN